MIWYCLNDIVAIYLIDNIAASAEIKIINIRLFGFHDDVYRAAHGPTLLK